MTAPERIWADGAEDRLLHIIPQSFYHGEATIYGAPDALKRLGEALIEASQTGSETTLRDVMPKDGEGYEVVILPRDQWQIEDEAPMPYAQLGLPWDLEPTDTLTPEEMRTVREALEAAKERLQYCADIFMDQGCKSRERACDNAAGGIIRALALLKEKG